MGCSRVILPLRCHSARPLTGWPLRVVKSTELGVREPESNPSGAAMAVGAQTERWEMLWPRRAFLQSLEGPVGQTQGGNGRLGRKDIAGKECKMSQGIAF